MTLNKAFAIIGMLFILAFTTGWTTVSEMYRNSDVVKNTILASVTKENGCSGTVIDKEKGLILTAYHCVDKFDDDYKTKLKGNFHVIYSSWTNYNGKTFNAILYKAAPEADLAIYKIIGKFSADVKDVPIVNFYPSFLNIGQHIISIGNSWGNYAQYYAKGVISRINETLPWTSISDVFMHTSDAVPGNSGGGIFDEDGNIVGVHVGGYRQQGGVSTPGWGFAIPSSYVIKLLNKKGM